MKTIDKTISTSHSFHDFVVCAICLHNPQTNTKKKKKKLPARVFRKNFLKTINYKCMIH